MDLLSPSISSTPKIGTDPLTRKRQSFTVYEMITNNERKQQKQLFDNNCYSSSFDNWNVNNKNKNSKIGQSIRDVMEHNYYLQNRKQQIQQNNRSPSVSGNFSIGLTTTTINNNKGRRLSERLINENNNGIIKGRLERSNSVLSSRNGNTNLNFIPELTPQQVSNLRRSWKHINTKGLYDVIRRAFSKLESSAPNVRSAFKNNYLDNQQQKNIGGTSKCGGIECELRLIGARHVPCYEYFNLNVTQLEQLGEALAEQFFKLDGIRQSKETTKVWRTLIAHIIDYIRD
uniref:GLOBIN domain-containing protein n=1 Tax=Meloidogyne floridensis TaxID=298350 RepID=A0A915P456_9BILA